MTPASTVTTVSPATSALAAAPTAPTVISIRHPAIATSTTETILALVMANLAADAPSIIQLSPTTKTATILLSAEIGISAILAIMQGLDAAKASSAAA